MITKENVILTVFLVVAIIYLLWLFIKSMKGAYCTEHFTEEYECRMSVMRVFDKTLNRKATQEEIDKYCKIQNEQDMLVAVIADYKNEIKVTEEMENNVAESSTDTVTTTTTPTTTTTTTPEAEPEAEAVVEPNLDVQKELDKINESVKNIKTFLNIK